MKQRPLYFLSIFVSATSLFAATLTPTTGDNSLIIYNSNVALVHESRSLSLSNGEAQIIYEDVASSINTDSVNVSLPSGVTLLSQQYRYDKLTQHKLLDTHIGKKVLLNLAKEGEDFKKIEVTLLSNDGSFCIVKHYDDILTVQSKNIIFQSIPNELITKPSLVWNITNAKAFQGSMSIDYLINQMSWKSDYILELHENTANLSGWITIQNNSGKAFNETELHLLAGDINRAYTPEHNYRVVKTMAMVADASPEVAHQAHEGYHFYTIPFKVSLANNEKTQIKFIAQNNIEAKRAYTVQMNHPNYFSGEVKHDVTQKVTLKGLELPLPKGVVRTYSKLQETNILLGESNIEHTPKNQPISLTLGKNFDVKVKETLTKRERGSWYHENDVTYTLENNSNETKIIELLVPFSNSSSDEIVSKVKYSFVQGNLVQFKLKVAANSTKTFDVFYKTKVQK